MPWGDGGLGAKGSVGGPRKRGNFGSGGISASQLAVSHAGKKHDHHGFFGEIGHIAGQTVTDLKNVAVNMPGGLYHTAGGLIHHPLPTLKAIGSSTVEDIKHPLRHPGYTLLDALALADLGLGTAARAGAVGEALRAGEAGRAASVALKGAKPEARFVKSPGTGEKVKAGTYSRAASTRTVQKALDKLRERHPNVRFGLRNQYERVGHARDKIARTEHAMRVAPAHQLVAAAKGLNKTQRLAMRVVAEEVPLSQRISHAETMLKEIGNTPRAKRLLNSHLKLLKQTGEYVHDVNGLPRFKPNHPHLIDVYEKTKTLANKREQMLQEGAGLKPETSARRKAAPGEIIRTDLHRAHGFDPSIVPEFFDNKEGFYVSYRHAKTAKAAGRPARLGTTDQVGVPRVNPLHGELTGYNLQHGLVNPDTPRVVAESHMEATRALSLWHERAQLQKIAKPQPTSHYDIPIRPIWLKNKPWPKEVRAWIDQLDKTLEPEKQQALSQKIRDYVLPKRDEIHPNEFDGKKIQWVDSRELGKINRPGPLATASQNPGFAKALRFTDKVNNAERLALLYLKPAYAVPNIVGNAFLNMVQQGVFAPVNLTKSVILNNRLGRELTAKIDTLVGEGISRSIVSPEARGIDQKLVEKASKVWQGPVDTPFRRASFLHEARREGFRTLKQVRRLLTDESLHDTLVRVADRANAEIIDYGNLGPVERDLVRRVLFLYPWVKGSTVYAGHFLGEHPIQAGVVSQLGKEGKQESDKLGPLPSYLEGLFQVGHRGKNPLVVNPAAAAIFQTPGAAAATVQGLIESGNPKEAYQFSQMVSPLLQALVNKPAGAKPNDSRLLDALKNLYLTTPQYTLYERLAHPANKNAKKIYPLNRRDALLQFLLGSGTPRPLNKAAANRAAYREANPRP